MAEKTKVTLIGPAKVDGKSRPAGATISVTDTQIAHLVEAGALPKGELPPALFADQDTADFVQGLVSDLQVAREEIGDLHDQLALQRENTSKEIAEIQSAADKRIAEAEAVATEQVNEVRTSANDQLAAHRNEADAKVAAIQAELDTLKADKAKPAK